MKHFASIPRAGLGVSTARRAGPISAPLAHTPLRRASSDARGQSAAPSATTAQGANVKMQSQTGGDRKTPAGPKSKTVSQLDEELRSRLEAMSGDGGAAGVEYENGRAEGLRSEVKRNMFRVINMK